MKKKILSLFLIMTLALTMTFGASGFASAASQGKITEAFEKCGDYIYETVTEPIYGSIGGEWVMHGLAQAGYPMSDEYIAKYQASVEKAVKEGYRGVPGQLHDRKYTEYSRVIVAYAALGLDPVLIRQDVWSNSRFHCKIRSRAASRYQNLSVLRSAVPLTAYPLP